MNNSRQRTREIRLPSREEIAEEKERLRAVLPEVGMWPELAERWLKRQLR